MTDYEVPILPPYPPPHRTRARARRRRGGLGLVLRAVVGLVVPARRRSRPR